MSAANPKPSPLVVPFLFDTSPAGRNALQVEADVYAVRILRSVNRARAVVDGDRHDALPILAARRRTLCILLTSYQRFKHARVFDPVVRLGSGSSKVVARTLKIECMSMGDAFSAYNARWHGMKQSEWSAYRPDMLLTTEALIDHVVSERTAIRKLLMISDLYDGALKSVELMPPVTAV